jgi:arylsulfatase B
MRGEDVANDPRYLTTAFEREACNFIEGNAKRPFLLYVPFNSVHSPMQAEPADVDRFAHIADTHRRIFAAMLWSLDKAVGAILQTLRRHRLDRDTLVVFISDNGGPVQELTSSNAPLRGQKGQLYEGGIRVPFLLQWPARIAGKQVVSDPVISLDLLPTFVAAAGAKVPENCDGVNLLPRLTGASKRPPHEQLYWRYDASAALRRGQWKLVRQARRGATAPWQLYDLANDIAETNDLAKREPERMNDMISKWEKLDREMVPPTELRRL